jgi:hypothetical protein
LSFVNESERTVLVPCHAGYVVKEAAQDHAMAHAALVKAQKSGHFKTAMCIQQSQGGLIKSGDYKMLILPYALREPALVNRNKEQYNKLWGAISSFNGDLGLGKVANLVQFLTSFKNELDQFIAEFECIPRQIGAIILIDGELVGFERTPSGSYFSSIWRALIRECYGSHALAVARGKKERGEPLLDQRVPFGDGFKTLEDLEQELARVRDLEEAQASQKVRGLIDDKFKVDKEQELEDYQLETISNPQFIGQIVRHKNGRIPYASLVTSREWARQKKWTSAPSFSI